MYNTQKVDEIRNIFIENGINIKKNQDDKIVNLDSLNFLSIMIDLEDYLGVSLDDNDLLFSLDYDTITFNQILACMEKHIK